MNKLLSGTIPLALLALAIVIPTHSMAGVDINIGISLPPPIVFQAPPEVIVLPDTDDVYVDPYIDVDLFFWNGWWWRFWDGRWYRSYYYDRGWAYYSGVPVFYFDVDPGWRGYCKDHDWHGHRLEYERISYQRLQQNWRSWHNDRHWERRGTWGVQNYQPRPQQRQELRQQRQAQYQERPEVQRVQRQWQQPQGQRSQVQSQRQAPQRQPQVQRYQQQRQEHQGYSQVRNPQDQPRRQPQVQQRERQKYQPQVQRQRQPQGRQPQVQRYQQQRQPQVRESQRQWQSQRQHSQPMGEQQRGRSQHQQSQAGNGRHRG